MKTNRGEDQRIEGERINTPTAFDVTPNDKVTSGCEADDKKSGDSKREGKGRLLKKSKILKTVQRLAQKQGVEVYLVGGAVRDLQMGIPPGKDFDFAVREGEDRLARSLAQETGGHAFLLDDQFGTWRIVIRKGGEKVELDFAHLQGRNIEEDLKNRDFTVNSMAFALKDVFGERNPGIMDPLQGMEDLKRGILRVNSEQAFLQDPLRMLRAFRFSATHKLRLEAGTFTLVQKHKSLIRKAAEERVRNEFFIALDQVSACEFLKGLDRSGLLQEIFSEVQGWESLDLDPPRHFFLLDHAFRTMETGEFILANLRGIFPALATRLEEHFSQSVEEGISRRMLLKFLCFFHDSGKPTTRQIASQGPTVRFMDHDQAGAKINMRIGQRIRLSRKSIRLLSEVTRHHMRLSSLAKTENLTERAKYRFFRDLGKSGIDLSLLALANSWGKEKIGSADLSPAPLGGEAEKMKTLVNGLLVYYFDTYNPRPLQPLLEGNEVMRILGLPPGKEVGNVLDALKSAEIAGKVRSREEALEFIKNIDISKPLG